MRILFPGNAARATVATAVVNNKTVGWLFNGGLLIYQGTVPKCFCTGNAANDLSLNGYCDFLVQGGTSGFAATAGLTSTDMADDTQAALAASANQL